MLDLIPLTVKQQKMVEEVAAAVYRPCCNNSTLFSDCNHVTAMLGLLELMASQVVTIDHMFETAKYVNAFWFPQQTLDVAIYLQTNYWIDFAHAAPRQAVGRELASASGFEMVHQSLVRSGEVKQAPSQGVGCSNCCGNKKHLSRGAFFFNLLTIFSI